MTLSREFLAKKLAPIFEDKPPTPVSFANRFSRAYAEYAQKAIAGPTTPIFSGSEWVRMSGPILGASVPIGVSAGFAAALALGLNLFWLGVPWTDGAGTFVGVTSVPGGPTALPGLIAALAAPQSSAQAANRLATCMDLGTRATMVAVTNTTSGVVTPTPIL